MSNQPPDRGKQGRSPTGALPSFSNQPTRALIPVMPSRSLDAIIAQMVGAGAQAVELLVPNGTTALQSVAGCEALRQAAGKAGLHITIFTADEQTAHAASQAKLDLIPVGSAVAAPEPRTPTQSLYTPRPPAPATQSPAKAPAPASPTETRTQAPPAASQPSAGTATFPPAPAVPATPQPPQRPRTDDDFLAGLAAFDQAAQPASEPPRLMESDQGALLFDAPGDVGVRRPATDDTDWEQAFGAMGTTMAAEPGQPKSRPARSRDRTSDARSSLARLTQGRTGRHRTQPADDTPQVQRPDLRPAEADQRRQQRLSLILLPLAVLALILVFGGLYLLYKRFAPGAQVPTLAVAPPPSTAGAKPYTGIVIPFSEQPISGTNTIAIQGRLLQAPVSVTVPGTAQSSASTPLGLATGTITLRNTTSQPIQIPAGKQIQANGTLFTFDGNVTVPPATSNADGVTFGKADASLTSTVAGEQGNLKAGTLTTAPQGSFPGIPGLKDALRIEQTSQFAGGKNEDVKIVRVEDVNQVLPQAISQLYATGVQALNIKKAEQPGWELPAATITPTIDVLKRLEGIQYTVLPPIGSVSSDGNFNVEVRSEFRAIASNTANGRLDDQILKAVRTQLISTRNVAPDSTINIASWTFRDQSLVVDASVQPPNQAPAFPAGFLTTVQKEIANKPRDEAEQILQQLVSDHKLARMPDLPAEWQTVPANVKLVQATQ